MKYNALVADDEYIIRRGIISFLKKYDNIQVKGEAEDGETAYEMACEQPYDLMFVDINMPFLNGLEFIKKLREAQPDVLVTIITGYDNFEYARTALSLQVSEYLLKPLMESAFDEAVKQLIDKLDQRKMDNHYLKWARTTLRKNRTPLLSEILRDWLEGMTVYEEIEQHLSFLEVRIPSTYTIIIIRLEYNDTKDIENQWNEELLYYAVSNIGNEIYENVQNLTITQRRSGDIIIISPLDTESSLAEKKIKCKSAIENCLPVSVSIAHRTGKGIENLQMLYQELFETIIQEQNCSYIIKQAKDYLSLHFSKEELSLQEVAEHIHLSAQHLSRLFRKELGETFINHLTMIRIRKAIELLDDDSVMLYEIADQVGYATQHYFCNVFKKNIGISPSEYRKNKNRSSE